jgi:hypothetical protein
MLMVSTLDEIKKELMLKKAGSRMDEEVKAETKEWNEMTE